MGGKWWSCLGLLFALVHHSHQATKDYYIGAVVEYQAANIEENAEASMLKNVNAFRKYIKEASEQGADIIVFPEYGVTSLNIPFNERIVPWLTAIPSVEERYVPCTGTRSDVSMAMLLLSCAARRYGIYVVANVGEKEACSKSDPECPARGAHYYNSNVVFDRKGQIIARYRKVNLFMENVFDLEKTPSAVTFDTDFGVKFGTFICFDILFQTPALNLTRLQGVKNFVYPVAWSSEVPFLTAPQVQAGWAFSENANLLASGYHNAMGASSGSGIYLGRQGIANVTYSHLPTQKLLIARIPKEPVPLPDNDTSIVKVEIFKKKLAPRIDNISKLEKSDVPYNTHYRREIIQGLNMRRDYITSFASSDLTGSMNNTICYESFCCHFDVDTSYLDLQPIYRAVVYKGTRMYGEQAVGGIRVCGLIQCTNSSVHSCGAVEDSNTVFTKIKITTAVDDYPAILSIPNTMNSILYPFDDNWTYNVNTRGQNTILSLNLDNPMKGIVAFGIYMRDYAKDVWVNLS